MKWSVRGLLEFSYIPGINEAYEGRRVDAPGCEGSQDSEGSMELNWLGYSEIN